MSRRNTTDFQTIHSEGGLLPPDLLRRLLDPKEKIPGTQPEDYGLPKGERINEVITQSWNRLRRHWTEFRNAATLSTGEASSDHSPLATHDSPSSPLATHDSPSSPLATRYSPLTSLTNDKWSLPLLRELGFGLLPASAGPELDGRTYAINRFFSAAAIHLVGCGVDLDRRAAGVRGAAAANPHGLVQEFLNRSQSHLWAIVSNGLRFRILRDNQALSRQSYLEFDLESMFNGEVYADFVLLWLTAHASRFMAAEDGKPESCLLEQWTKVANEQGARALESLRGGVERALQVLGQGFVGHPRNTALREALRSGQVSLSDFHGQLLRVVYRLIFLFVTEDRTLDGIPILHTREEEASSERRAASGEKTASSAMSQDRSLSDASIPHSEFRIPNSPDSPLTTRHSLYSQYYSTTRLRDLAARIRGSRHGDLWQQFNLLVGALSGAEQFAAVREQLALPALGSLLWNPDSTWALNAECLASSEKRVASSSEKDMSSSSIPHSAFRIPHSPDLPLATHHSPLATHLTNADFLDAIRHLAFTRQDKILRPVDYKNLGAEELGGVYESLLALTPQISGDGNRFSFAEFSGNERKTSGSYYTPDCLVQCLLDSALDPVVEERLETAARVARSEWRVVEEEMQKNQEIMNYVNSILPRLGSVATGDGTGANGLRNNEKISKGGTLRNDFSDSQSGSVSAGERSGRMGAGRDDRVCSFSAHSQGKSPGTGNTSHTESSGEPATGERSTTASGSGGNAEPKTPGLTAQSPEEKTVVKTGDFLPRATQPSRLAELWSSTPLATRHSLLTEHAVLGMRVCDPACGSGHFLVGAAHRLARHLARVRALAQGDSEPSPMLYQHALRDIIGHCLYGVDINPMAVELCKISLWLEALEPGKPLSFLDHHIQCGNSLIGATPELIEQGIPDDAFTPIEGDDRAHCTKYKRKNREESTQMELEEYAPWEQLGNLPAAIAKLDALKDDTINSIQEKQRRYEAFIRSADYVHSRFLADVWCAAFVWPKRDNKALPYPITNKVLRQIERNPQSVHDFTPWLRDEVQRIAKQYHFFHWHLAFPEVFTNDGFDCVLGNPPWEKINFKTAEFFAHIRPDISGAANKAQRKTMLEILQIEDPMLFSRYIQAKEAQDRLSVFFRFSGRYPWTGVSRVNLYSVFCEISVDLLSNYGRLGFVIASGIMTDENNKVLLSSLMKNQRLIHAWDFENREGIFPDVHLSYHFCLFCAGGINTNLAKPDFLFYAGNIEEVNDQNRHFNLTNQDLALLNPDSRTCPTFRNREESELAKRVYRLIPTVNLHSKEVEWPGTPKTPFNMSNDAGLFSKIGEISVSNYLPVYESKYIHQFNHRYATVVNNSTEEVVELKSEELLCANFSIESRYWLDINILSSRFPGQWFVVYRMITRATDERTAIVCIIPKRPCVNSLSIIEGLSAVTASIIVASTNSFVHDYCVRQKVSGTNFNHWIWNQLPILTLSTINGPCSWDAELPSLTNWLLMQVLELTYTAYDLEPFARDCGWNGPPFRWDEERRFLLRCELDAAFFHLYLGSEANGEWRMAKKEDGCPYDETPEQLAELKKHFPTPRHAVNYIMDTFPIVKRKDEAAHGHYRTKDTILDIYDAMQRAIATGEPYQTRLDPPPADPRCCHPPKGDAK